MIAILTIRQKGLKSPEFNKKEGKILNIIILVKTENTALQQKVVLIQDLNISEKKPSEQFIKNKENKS